MTEESSNQHLAYMCAPAVVLNDDEDGSVNFEETNKHINRIAADGWTLITIDNGLGYWSKDISEFVEAVTKRCGHCAQFRGNLCSKFGYSVTSDEAPTSDGCYEEIVDGRDEQS